MLKRVLVEIRKYRAIPKDPISLLMELGQVTSKSPTFDISTRNLLSSGCQFLCKASFLYIDKESTGSSKQDAKRAASIEILKALLLDMDEDISLYQDTLFGHSAVQVPMKYPISTSPSNTVEKNYIGMLQEHAQQGLISFPAYIDCKEEGPPHIRTFTVEAKLPREGLKARATGSTKKAAKKDAARMLYEQLQRLWQSSGRNSYGPSFPRVSLGEESPALPSSGPSKGRVSFSGFSKSLTESKDSDTELFSDDKPSSLTSKLSDLRIGCQDVNIYNAISSLLQWGKSRGVNITCHEQESRKPSCRLMFVKVNVDPPVVSAGEGKTVEEAYALGALHALEQLSTMGYLKV